MDVQVTTLDGQLCGCGLEPLLQVEMPDSDAPGGRSARMLCAGCGASSATGQALLAWFAENTVVTEEDVEEFGALVQRWLEDVTPAQFSTTQLERAREAWQRDC